MNDRDTMTVLRQCVDMLEDDLDGMPQHIDRPGKEDFVLVSSRTYSALIHRIRELEDRFVSDEDRTEEERYLLSLLEGRRE